MDLKQSFGIDKRDAESGKWFDLEDGGRVRVAKLGCLRFKAEVQRLQKPHLAVLQSSMDSSELLDKITVVAMSRTILVDWDNINLDGEAVEYSSAKAEEMMLMFPDFREIVSALSIERRNFMPEELAEK